MVAPFVYWLQAKTIGVEGTEVHGGHAAISIALNYRCDKSVPDAVVRQPPRRRVAFAWRQTQSETRDKNKKYELFCA